MLALGLLVTLGVWLAAWAAGEFVARLIFGPRRALIAPEARPVLGIAAITVLLELVGHSFAIRIAAWLLVPAVIAGLYYLVRAGGLVQARRWDLALVSLFALGLGLMPVLIAGRFTASALTNNDGTYYISVAERLLALPWTTDTRFDPPECFTAYILFGWFWRTGTPNLIAAISALTSLPITESLAIVTAVLVSCVAAPALALARRLGVRSKSPRLVLVGALATLAAGALFLAYQHLLGQLAAYFLFPLACAATFAAAGAGGVRRIAYAAILVAASLAWLADAAVVLVGAFALGAALSRRGMLRGLRNAALLGVATLAVGPFTAYRALLAAYRTVAERVPAPGPVFTQRGWLERPALDDLATVTGVDPWPPWPAPWPPTVESLVMYAAALAGLALLGIAAWRLRRDRALLSWTIATALAFVASVAIVETRYLLGKVLLMAGAFALPACATGAAIVKSWRLAPLVAVFVLGELTAAQSLLRPSRWTVIDRPDHDALLALLDPLPEGALIALDGLGSPADPVLDAHRAHRAALSARTTPIQPGLDGGFYIPKCKDPPELSQLPAKGYALQRMSAENLSVGRLLATVGDFRLLEIDFQQSQAVLGAWASTHGWHAAEREPNGRVFRWGEQRAKATLRVVVPSPCMRLHGTLRTAGPEALVTLSHGESSLFRGQIGPNWSSFDTLPLEASVAREIDFELVNFRGSPPDPAHALALSSLEVKPEWSCLSVVRAGAPSSELAEQRGQDLIDSLRWYVTPAAGLECAKLVITVDGAAGHALGIGFDKKSVSWHQIESQSARVVTPAGRLAKSFTLALSRRDKSAPPWRIVDVIAKQAECEK